MDLSHGLTSRRPVLSQDGRWLAAIGDDKDVQIIDMSSTTTHGRLYRKIRLQDPKLASRINTIRWSPVATSSAFEGIAFEREQPPTDSRILLSDSRYIQIYSVTETDRRRQLLFHVDMGDTFGKITYVDFAFDHRHALVMTEMNIHATILTIDTRSYIELKSPKFSSANSFAFHPKGHHLSLLARLDGKDIVTTYKVGESSWTPETTANCSTVDAQGIIWSPDGRFMAVWDTASMGCTIKFCTADGQPLTHMDITETGAGLDFAEFEGLGVKSVAWLSASNILTVVDYSGHIVLRRLDASYQWTVVDIFSHLDQLEDPSTFVWQEVSEKDQLIEQNARPFTLPTVPPLTANGVPRTVEQMVENIDSSMIASTSGLAPSTVWVWQGFRSPLAVLSFRDPVRQILWHPQIPDALLILTTATKSRVHLWTKSNPPRSVDVQMARAADSSSGKLEVKWVRRNEQKKTRDETEGEDGEDGHQQLKKEPPTKDEDYLFLLTHETSFDLGFITQDFTNNDRNDNMLRFRSILNI